LNESLFFLIWTPVAKSLACDEAFKAAGWMHVQVKVHWLLVGFSAYPMVLDGDL
jgi:hypothetical protein